MSTVQVTYRSSLIQGKGVTLPPCNGDTSQDLKSETLVLPHQELQTLDDVLHQGKTFAQR